MRRKATVVHHSDVRATKRLVILTNESVENHRRLFFIHIETLNSLIYFQKILIVGTYFTSAATPLPHIGYQTRVSLS